MDKNAIAKLQNPFDPFDIEWRVQQMGKGSSGTMYALVLPYVTNRAIQQRLDDVCGAENWRNEYQYIEKAVLCGISIRMGIEWITKWDGAEETNIEAVKGGLSNAMKRAAVQWGIGRYLYRLDSVFVNPTTDKPPKNEEDGWIQTQANYEGKKQRIAFKRPSLPKFATDKAGE